MVIQAEKPVSLVTADKSLVEIMLSEYPGILKEGQIKKVKKDRERVYSFEGLNKQQLEEFLDKYKFTGYLVIENDI